MNILKTWQTGIDRLLKDRSPRERQVLTWGVALGMLMIFIFGFWIPLQQAQLRLERSVSAERKRLAVMGAAKLELASIKNPTSQQSPPALSRPTIEAQTRTQLTPSALDIRMEGDHGMKITFSGAHMPQLVKWIDDLSRSQRIHVTFARLRPEGAAITGEIQFSGTEP